MERTNGSSEGNDPRHVAVVAAYVTLPRGLEASAFFRLASSLPNPALEGCTTIDARLGWRPAKQWEIALVGRNLLDRQRPEFVTTNSLDEEVTRSALLKVTWRR